jgi:hypothetical protein
MSDDCSRSGSAEQLAVYRKAMEAAGEEVVRTRFANRMAITDDGNTNPPPGVAILWLQKQPLKRARHESVKFWSSARMRSQVEPPRVPSEVLNIVLTVNSS